MIVPIILLSLTFFVKFCLAAHYRLPFHRERSNIFIGKEHVQESKDVISTCQLSHCSLLWIQDFAGLFIHDHSHRFLFEVRAGVGGEAN